MASLGSSDNRPVEWTTAGREAQHRLQLKNWNEKKESWSGSGKHVKDNEIRYTMPSTGEELGNGIASFVEKIHYRSLPLARKLVRGNRYRPISELRQEVDIMERIVHHHIVILVGSYTSTLRQHRLYLLIYPAAVCDLKTFLHDIDDIRHGSSYSTETSKRFDSLGFKLVLPNAQSTSSQLINWKEPLKYLRSILGCITEAVVYIHDKKIRHRDLKPENILLAPKRVYVADFGISRNLEDASNSLTEGYAGGTKMYQAPEASEKQEHHMSPSEIYSLGAIFLCIATVLYNENQSLFDSIMKEPEVRLKASRITSFLQRLRNAANIEDLAHTPGTRDQKHSIDLIETMLDYEPKNRPTALEVSHSLVELGGQEQIYHEECCRKDATQIASIRGSIIRTFEAKEASRSQEIRELRAKLQLNDTKVHSMEKELKIVKDGFDSRLATEKRDLSNSWQHHLDIEKRKHEASKAELVIARRRIKKLEDDNQRLQGRKDKRNHPRGLEYRSGVSHSAKTKERDGASTPSRIPIRNSSSPHIPPRPKSFKSSPKLTDGKVESDSNLHTPTQVQQSDESDLYSMMASGITLVGSVSSASPRSLSPPSPSPPSPSISKSKIIVVPTINATVIDTLDVKVPSGVSKSYADMLKPNTVLKKIGIEPPTVKHHLTPTKGTGAWTKKTIFPVKP